MVLSDEALRDLFREAGKQVHPDAGGGEGEFAALRDAYATLASPSRRLMCWLEFCGTPGEVRGSIEAALMDLFSEVGAVTQQAEAVIRKREEARSPLVRALLESETQVSREAVKRTISRVESWITQECADFSNWEVAEVIEVDAISQVARNLAFLEKWRGSLRACFSRLV